MQKTCGDGGIWMCLAQGVTEVQCAAGGYGLGYGQMSQILRDVVGNRAGIGMMGVVDDDGNGLVMTNGG